MKNFSETSKDLILIGGVLLICLLITNQAVEFRYKAQLIGNPCGRCQDLGFKCYEPIKDLINLEHYYNNSNTNLYLNDT